MVNTPPPWSFAHTYPEPSEQTMKFFEEQDNKSSPNSFDRIVIDQHAYRWKSNQIHQQGNFGSGKQEEINLEERLKNLTGEFVASYTLIITRYAGKCRSEQRSVLWNLFRVLDSLSRGKPLAQTKLHSLLLEERVGGTAFRTRYTLAIMSAEAEEEDFDTLERVKSDLDHIIDIATQIAKQP